MDEGSFEIGDKLCSHSCSGILITESAFRNEVSPSWVSDGGGLEGSPRSLDNCLCVKFDDESCSSVDTMLSTDRSISGWIDWDWFCFVAENTVLHPEIVEACCLGFDAGIVLWLSLHLSYIIWTD